MSAEGAPSLPLGALSRELPTRCHSQLQCGTPTLETPGASSGGLRHLLFRIRHHRQWSTVRWVYPSTIPLPPGSCRRQDRGAPWSGVTSSRQLHPEPTEAFDRWRRVESHRRVCRAQRSTGIHPRTLRRGYSRLQPEGRHEAGGLQVLHGGVKNATGDPSPRPPGSVADRCRAGTAGRPLRRPDGSVSTLRVELHAHQGADGLAVLGSPWRIPLPMDLRRLPGGDGISRRAALRADSESVGRAYRWALAGTTVSVELIATGDR